MAYKYVMSDIHGNYEKYIQALKIVNLKADDTLYVLGDVLDRGDHPIKILQDMMEKPNVIPILGNHEFNAFNILKKMTFESLSKFDFDEEFLEDFELWMADGGQSTLDEFKNLSQEEKEKITDYLMEFELYEEVFCGGKEYILVHAGLQNFDSSKDLFDYELYDFISGRADYNKVHYDDKILVTGHTPTRLIMPNNGDKIYKANNHIAIDCGCGFGGKLGIIRLDDEQEFYV